MRLAIQQRQLVLLGTLTAALALAVALPLSASGAPGGVTQAQVDTMINNGLSYLGSLQQPDGSWDTGGGIRIAETGLAVASYGVKDEGDLSRLTPAERTQLTTGMNALLGMQSSSGAFDGNGSDFLKTYNTGIALMALSLNPGVLPGEPAAIASGRDYLIKNQTAPPSVTGNAATPNCSSVDGVGSGQSYCGGWDYSGNNSRSDESNTGFGLTGLELSGGVPAAAQQVNVGWQRHVQQTNCQGGTLAFPNCSTFATRNDGGGSYEPGINSSDFSSNANDTGSLIFGYAYDGVPASDSMASKAIRFGNDVIDEYQLMKGTTPHHMVFHSGQEEDGTCTIGAAGCDWSFAPGEGGYHYSIWALSKGLGQYTVGDLADPANFYAKAVDLLFSEQASDGSWPADLRDDGSIVGSTAFAILTLGRVGAKPAPTPARPAAQTAPARVDRTAPRVTVAAVPRGCVRRAFSARFRISESNLRRVSVYLDGKRIASTSRKAFSVRVNAARLRTGRHRIRVVAVDRSGNRRSVSRVFARCARPAAVVPHFTG